MSPVIDRGGKVLSAKEAKDSVVSVRFLREEKQRLTDMATEQNRGLSETIGSIALGHLKRERKKIVPEVNRKLYFEPGEISERLQEEELDRATLVDLEKFLVRVRRELLGLEPLPDREERSIIMIAKQIQGTDFHKVLDYFHNKSEARLIGSNMTGQDPDTLAEEFRVSSNLRERLTKRVYHVSLSASPAEKLTGRC